MLQLAKETVQAYARRMEDTAVPEGERPAFRKWIRFHLDFCGKHGHPPGDRSSVDPFLAKLASKNQSVAARAQAASAVNLLLWRRGASAPVVGGEADTDVSAGTALDKTGVTRMALT
jgi:hypothetical protein